jgi:hypothetical protein
MAEHLAGVHAAGGLLVRREPHALPLDDERGRIDRLQPALPREAVRAVPHEEHVLALQHLAREADRVLDPVHARDRADVEVAAVHQRRVHLDAPLAVEHAPEAGVERGVVLEVRDGGCTASRRCRCRGGSPTPPRWPGAPLSRWAFTCRTPTPPWTTR